MTPIGKKISFFENIGRTLTRAAFVVGFFSLAASFLGMFRDRMLAGYFGAGPELDVYYAAFRVPDFFFNTILVSITSSAFLPVLTRYLHKPGQKTPARKGEEKNLLFPQEAQDFIESLTSILMVGLFAVTLVLWIIAPYLSRWIAPGFTPEQQQATVTLTRIMLISPIFLSFSGILSNILNLRNYFFFYSLTPFVYNLGSIFAILFFVPYYGITGLAWGIVLGAILHFAIQFFPAFSMGLKIKWQWNPFHPGIKKVFLMMLPRSFHLGLLQGNLIITTLLASILPTGSLTVFTLANNIQGLPLGLFAASFAIAIFPTLSILAAKEDTEKFRQEFSHVMCQILFFIIPLSVMIIILRAQMVRIILGTGRFNWEDTVLTLNVLGVLAVSLFAQGLNLLFVRAFFALHDTVTPLKSAIVGVVVNIAIGALAVRHWDWVSPLLTRNSHLASMDSPIMGLALAYTASQIAIFIFLFVGLHTYLKGIESSEFKKSLGKIAVATLITGIVTQLVKWAWGQLIPLSTFTAVAGQIILSGLLGVAVYLLISKILKSKELIDFYNECPKILRRKKIVPE